MSEVTQSLLWDGDKNLSIRDVNIGSLYNFPDAYVTLVIL